MSSAPTAEALDIARLKQAFGAELEPAEERLLAQRADSDDDSPAWLRTCLSAWNPMPDPEGERRSSGPPELVERFEQSTLAGSRKFLRSFPRFVAFVLTVASVPAFVVVYLKTGGLPLRPLAEVLAFMWAVMGAFCFACWRRARQTLRQSDLIQFVSARETGTHQSPATRALQWLSLALLWVWQARRVGWVSASLTLAGLFAVMWIAARWLRRNEARTRISQDEELWTWWYGRDEDRPADPKG